ncbi:MAG TPA: glycosyltransferase [Bacteroidales bacterium]|nr:glycosyltransferase [Bacteroidales bacterium]
MKKKYNILICPLEWGLGHAGRIIPLAVKLHEMGHNVIIGAGEKHLSFFRKETKDFTLIKFPGFSPKYSGFLPQYLVILAKVPSLIFHIIREHHKIKRIIRQYDIDILISDNRFGLWNNDIITVYLTHMIVIPMPKPFRFMEFAGILLHRAIIKKYNYCFIPDLPGHLNISGRLSHTGKLPSNTRFIGILSRFTTQGIAHSKEPCSFSHNTVIISGPSPQSEILQEKLSGIFIDRQPVTVILGGKPGEAAKEVRKGNIIWYNHLPAAAMKEIITGSDQVIARAGYTTIMELISLGCSGILIPTPGQTEQEYLAAYLSEKGWFTSVLQKDIDSFLFSEKTDISQREEIIAQSRKLFEETLTELLEDHKHST